MNPWVQHVKAYQTKHKCSYKHALKHARASYNPKPQRGKGIWGDIAQSLTSTAGDVLEIVPVAGKAIKKGLKQAGNVVARAENDYDRRKNIQERYRNARARSKLAGITENRMNRAKRQIKLAVAKHAKK